MRRRVGVIAFATVASGCGRLGFGAVSVEGDARGADAPVDPAATTQGPDVGRSTPAQTPDATPSDAGANNVADASSDVDAQGLADIRGDAAQAPAALEWIALSAGTFDMGSTAMSNSQPVHQVSMRAFDIGRTEVTVGQYLACVDASACSAPGSFSALCYWSDESYASHPVNCVSHTQAVSFCAWVGGRLPSEAEWEYAARSGGEARTFPWGDEPASCDLAILSIGGDGCGSATPWPVCSLIAGNTRQGVCDMAGNVFEWTLDAWHNSYVGAPTDGSAWDGSNKVVRGGNFLSGPWTSAQRGVYFGASYLNTFIGFRCVR